ncbi:hypothetical protein Acid7E03_10620 [Acidisoma sp. 7E03]
MVRLLQAGETAEQRGFALAVAGHEPDTLTRRKIEGETAKQGMRGNDAEVVQTDERHGETA